MSVPLKVLPIDTAHGVRTGDVLICHMMVMMLVRRQARMDERVDLGKLRGILYKAYTRNSIYFGLRATIAMLFINKNQNMGVLPRTLQVCIIALKSYRD